VDPTGRFVYTANQNSTVSQYSINTSTGALTSITTDISTGNNPRCIAVDPTGKFVYVTTYNGGTINQYSINQITGALTSITTAITVGNNPYGVAVDPTGRFLYVAHNSDNTVGQYLINNFIAAGSALINPTITNYTETVNAITAGTTATINLSLGTVVTFTISGGNATITMPTAVAGKSFILILTQDSVARTVTWSTVVWPSATAPTISTGSGKRDIFSFFSNGTSWFGSTIGQNYT
jgi:hypothetical protein